MEIEEESDNEVAEKAMEVEVEDEDEEWTPRASRLFFPCNCGENLLVQWFSLMHYEFSDK